MNREELLNRLGERLSRYWFSRIEQEYPAAVSNGHRFKERFKSLLRQALNQSGELRVSEDSPESGMMRKIFPSVPPGLVDLQELARELAMPERAVPEQSGIIGDDPELLSVLRAAVNLSRSRVPVLIIGETGTGKELLAELIHHSSDRYEKPWIPVNCGALTESLLESELFGHEPNSFTGAGPRGREGRIEAADSGTLFLDEIAELPLSGQAKLLRFLDRGELQKVGRAKPVKVDVRVICATHRNLEELVSQKIFRQDLYYRIALVDLTLPPLRNRVKDIPLLARHFLREMQRQYSKTQPASISDETFKMLQSRSWPGNIREMKFTLERAFIQCHEAVLKPEHLPGEKPTPIASSDSSSLSTQAEKLSAQLAKVRASLFPDRPHWTRFLLRHASIPITNSMIVAEFKMSEAGARIRLNSLVQLGILAAEGAKKGRKYYLLPPFSA